MRENTIKEIRSKGGDLVINCREKVIGSGKGAGGP